MRHVLIRGSALTAPFLFLALSEEVVEKDEVCCDVARDRHVEGF